MTEPETKKHAFETDYLVRSLGDGKKASVPSGAFLIEASGAKDIVKIMPSGAMVICSGLSAEEALFETLRTMFSTLDKTNDLPFPSSMTIVEYEA